ncbi:MAG: tetratricopeptide repeat protein [Bacteroidales bacterium]|nr:tetratricopeptide repeat protein [Bacteroidales bacterium]
MRNLAGIMLIAIVLSGCGLSKMVKNYDQVNYEVTPEVLEEHGDEVKVTVEGTFPENYFHKKAIVNFKPVLQYEGGETELNSITLKGEKAEGEGKVISKETGGSFTYSETFNFKPEMKASELMLSAEASLKNKSEKLGQRKLADGVIYTSNRIMHDENLIMAPHGYEKETIVTKEGKIFFHINRSNLNWNFDLNKEKETKEQMAKLKDFLCKGWKIKNIEIRAWASPDGELDFNEKLAENRMETTTRYLKGVFETLAEKEGCKLEITDPENETNFVTTAQGEDWQGFIREVKESDIDEKNMIVRVVNAETDPQKREQEIRNMSVVFEELTETVLPRLRRAEIVVNCYEPKFSDQELKELAVTKPDTLKLNEMLYAATLHNDLNTKEEIYETTIEQHPKCWRAKNNAAAVAIKLGNHRKAADYLEKAEKASKGKGMVMNNLGAIESKKEDYANAKSLYNEAKNKGTDVDYNLGIVSIHEGDYQKALNHFGNERCNYNVALTELMLDNTADAADQLKCTQKDAMDYYLMAVIGARTGDNDMLYDNLRKAIKEDTQYKEEAKTDREFIEYFEKPEFKEIVK